MKKWMLCVKGTTKLIEGDNYLIEPRGKNAKVLQWQKNPHVALGFIVSMSRFIDIEYEEDMDEPLEEYVQNQLDLFNNQERIDCENYLIGGKK